MKEAVVKEQLQQLCDVMKMLPAPEAGKDASEGMYCPHLPGKQQTVEEVIDHLRLQVKYLVFDLEATRRENRYLRQMLENRNRRRGLDSNDPPSDF